MVTELTLDERLALARNVRAKGYNCAQTVMAAFPDIFNLPEQTLMQLGSCCGGGMGLTGNICGALTAAALAEGMRYEGLPTEKAAAYGSFRALHDDFRTKHGHVLCPDLKKAGIDCNTLIWSTIEQYHNHLNQE